jgi:sucrose phosphorylase
VDYLGLDLLILTETNVPHGENISYFGDGDEARLVYNFALPPLVLHGIISGDAGPLARWAASLSPPSPGTYFLNFLASHDGVGLTPARGLVDPDAFAGTVEEATRCGALVSMKATPEGEVPYELNCSWADMTAPPDGGEGPRAAALLSCYGAALSLPGLPAVYFHSWVGSRGWKDGPRLLGYNRAINREKPALDALEEALDDEGAFRSLVYRGFSHLFAFRRKEACFHPSAPFSVFPAGKSLFVIVRGPDAAGRKAVCAHNFGQGAAPLDLSPLGLGEVTVPGPGLLWTAFGGETSKRELVL